MVECLRALDADADAEYTSDAPRRGVTESAFSIHYHVLLIVQRSLSGFGSYHKSGTCTSAIFRSISCCASVGACRCNYRRLVNVFVGHGACFRLLHHYYCISSDVSTATWSRILSRHTARIYISVWPSCSAHRCSSSQTHPLSQPAYSTSSSIESSNSLRTCHPRTYDTTYIHPQNHPKVPLIPHILSRALPTRLLLRAKSVAKVPDEKHPGIWITHWSCYFALD